MMNVVTYKLGFSGTRSNLIYTALSDRKHNHAVQTSPVKRSPKRTSFTAVRKKQKNKKRNWKWDSISLSRISKRQGAREAISRQHPYVYTIIDNVPVFM